MLQMLIRDDNGREIVLPSPEQVGDWLKNGRSAKGKSLQEVADACGVTRQAVYCWEASKTSPTMDNLLKLVQFLYSTAKDDAIEATLDEVDALLSPHANSDSR